MDDIQHLNTTTCADLERLASAAATAEYSSNLPISSHDSEINSARQSQLPSELLNTYPLNTCELSRFQLYGTLRVGEYQPRTLGGQVQNVPYSSLDPEVVPSNNSNERVTEYAMVQRLDPVTHFTKSPQYVQGPSRKNLSNSEINFIDARLHAPMESIAIASELEETPPANEDNHHTTSIDSSPKVLHIPDCANQTKKVKKKKEERCDPSSSKATKKKKVCFEISQPVDIDGKKCFVCSVCNEKFLRKYNFSRHLFLHSGDKRGSLSLETKAEIIKRFKAGEKQVDLAVEYNLGRSTLSFIIKNSDKFLGVLKGGKFHPETKRLRGAQREDVEEALHEWYKQALLMGSVVSGPILCQKAKDFAGKLGYQEFKATHGWLDRFKHRKKISLGRSKNAKETPLVEEVAEMKGDFMEHVLPTMLVDYDSNDIFYASETGIMYNVLPDKASQMQGNRCAGGSQSKRRITVLLCVNMSGSEKFPLWVVGKHAKPKCFKHIKSLPVHYLSQSKAWMSKENFDLWLSNLDSWFTQQGRRVLLIVPSLPIHPKRMKLDAVNVVIAPPSFVGPCKFGIVHVLKKNYRRSIIEYHLNYLEKHPCLKKRRVKKSLMSLNLLQCLHKLSAAWHAVSDITINNSFQRSGLGKFGFWRLNLIPDLMLGTENLDLFYRLKKLGVLKILEEFTFEDYVSFDDHVQVCHLMDDDDIIASITGASAESSDSEIENNLENVKREDENKENSSKEKTIGPSLADVKLSIETIQNHIGGYNVQMSEELYRLLVELEYLIVRSNNSQSVTESTNADEEP